MQLTGPVFLFLFLPLSFFAVLPFSGRRRAAALLIVSLCWYLCANRQNPAGMIVTGALLLLCWLLTLPRGARRLRLTLGVALPIAVWLFCRITAEYGLWPRLSYPAGLTFVALGLVSAAVDLYHAPDAAGARRPVAFFGYVLFFPVLTFGPVIRYRRFRRMLAAERPSFAAFARGSRLFTAGYLKRAAGAAMLISALNRVLAVEGEALHLPAAGVLLILAGAALPLLVSGVSDMARGVASFYGLVLLPDVRLLPLDPARCFGGLCLSLSAFLDETVVRPVSCLRTRAARPLAWTLGFVCTVLFFRCRWEALLLSLPLFAVTAAAAALGREPAKVRRVLLAVLLTPAYLLFAAGVLLPEPVLLFRMFSAASDDPYYLYQLFAALSDARYLLLMIAVAAALLVWRHYRSFALLRLSVNARTRVAFAETLLLFVAFAGAVIFILPRFPVLADQPFMRLYL